MKIAVIGGGAAGFFAAIECATANRDCAVTIFERGRAVLEKVRISGGGRCNVTHACFDPRDLVKNYPRGSRELLGPFMQFGPADTVEWFESRGVPLKTEADGRMFPVSDNSMSIVQCLTRCAQEAGVRLLTGRRIDRLTPRQGGWEIDGQYYDRVLIATGASAGMWACLHALGHCIVPPAPSLFTFNTKDHRLRDLSGVSVPKVALKAPALHVSAEGPLLVTHWGLSGPAVLRMSAWGAREMQAVDYKFSLEVNFTGMATAEAAAILQSTRQQQGKKTMAGHALFQLPSRLWQHLVAAAGITPERRWADMNKAEGQALQEQLCAAVFYITGKSVFKEEFVTAGGISLKEVHFKTFESRLYPGLYFAGEILDIDAITGGFNFQAAWTGAYLAGNAMAHPAR